MPSQESVSDLLVRHDKVIRHILERRSGTRILRLTTIEDLYQETVAAALSSEASFQYVDDARFLGWISTIARRVIARQLGTPHQALRPVRIRGDESSGVGMAAGDLPSFQRSPSSSAAMHENKDALQLAIRELPEHYEKVIRLYEIEERSLSEVAAAMRRTKGATCRLLARARAALYQKLRK